MKEDIAGILFDFEAFGEPVLACPECWCYYSHVRSAVTALGSDAYEGSEPYDGTVSRGCVGARRCCLVITVDGECGHAWEIRIQQHKGNNFVTTRILTEDVEAQHDA